MDVPTVNPLQAMTNTVVTTPATPATSSTQTPLTAQPISVKPPPLNPMLNIKSPVVMKSIMGASRGAEERGKYTRGGAQYRDAVTEAAVMKALRWLKYIQNEDGSMPGGTAMTGLAVLTYLAHGETPGSKEFGPTVQKALDYLVNSVYVVRGKDGREEKDPNGKTPYVKMKGTDGNEYGFLIGTYALCEAYGMTQNPNVREAAEKTLARIISGQGPTGGWNYRLARKPVEGAADDISFGGWAMQALKAGKMAGIHLPGQEECIKKAMKCLKTRNYSEKAGFVYRATFNHKGGSGGLGGVGCLCMQQFGHGKDKEVANALRVMTDWLPTFDKKHMSGGESSQYYSYYASQCKYQAGMCRGALPADAVAWAKWNAAQKRLYPRSIVEYKVDHRTGKPAVYRDEKDREQPMGYWLNNDTHSSRILGRGPGGKTVTMGVMDTCLVALQLMVYYRYLPLIGPVPVPGPGTDNSETPVVNIEI